MIQKLTPRLLSWVSLFVHLFSLRFEPHALFTGLSIYYVAPLFSGFNPPVSTLISLDGEPPIWIDLSAPADSKKRAAEDLGYNYRWSRVGLPNGTHTLSIFPGASPGGQVGTWGIVDGFV